MGAAHSISIPIARVPGPEPHLVRRLDRFVAFASLLSMAVGLLAVIGWMLPGEAARKPGAEIALLLCGGSLWLLRFDPTRFSGLEVERDRRARLPDGRGQMPPGGRRAPFGVRLIRMRRIGQVLASIVALVGLLSMLEYLFGWPLRIDYLLFDDATPGRTFASAHAGLMAPITALNFLLLGFALLWLDWTPTIGAQRYGPAQFLAFAANTGAIICLLDFVLGTHGSYPHVALPTAISLFVLSLGVAGARTGRGLGTLLVSSGVAGVLTRRLWSSAILVPLLVGTLSWKAHSAGSLSEWTAIAVMIVAMITLLAGLAVRSGQSLDRTDTERWQAEVSLQRSEEELREAQRLASMGSWWWVPATDTVSWSEGLYRIAGCDPKLPPPGFKDHSRFYTAESFARLAAAVERAAQAGAPFELELELVRGDGAIRSVTSRGEAERAADGKVSLVRGSVEDVTERKRAEDALRASETNLSKAQGIAHLGSWHLDVARNQLSWSDEVFRIFGVAPGTPLTYEAFLGTVHPADKETVERAWTNAMRGGPYDVEHRILVNGSVKWVRERAEVEFDQSGRAVKGIGTVQDITERKHAQQELLRLNRALRALSSCNGALIRATRESAWLNQVCRIVVEETGYRLCWVGRLENDEAKTVTVVAQAGFDEGYLAGVRVTWADTERGQGPTGRCIRTQKTQIVKDVATDPSFAPWRDAALKRGYASVIVIPLVVDAVLFGSLNIYASETGTFRDEEVVLLTELANDLAFGIGALRSTARREKAEGDLRQLNTELDQRVRARTADLEAARDREAKIGFRIQQMLLLTQPPADVPGLQIAALTLPSQRIDGDFYDFFKHENQCLDVIVADVMGKGLPAALVAAATKSNVLEAMCHLTALGGGQLPEPKEIVTLAHADMVRQLIDLESFVTMSYARFDLGRHQLDLVDCGHTGMMVVRAATGASEILHGENLPLGIREGEMFDQLAVGFEPGDLFIFFSDGITDIRNGAGEFYGVDRLAACVRANRELQARALVEAIRTAATAFAQTDQLTDDLTCVVVRVGDERRPIAKSSLEIRSDPRELSRAREFVREFCRTVPALNIDDDVVASLVLALNEAASNVMKHAYHGRTDQRIRIEAGAFPDRVSIQLHHLGDAFDPHSIAPPAFDGSRESGFGIYLMTRSVDEVRHSRDDRGQNCIALVKILGSQRRRKR